MAQQTFSGVPGDFSAGQVLTAADMDKLREFLLYLIKDGDETDTGEVSPLIMDLGSDTVTIGGNPVQAGAWTAWTPTITGTTIGNATVLGNYAQFGKTVHFTLYITFGDTTSFGGTYFVFTAPVARDTNSLYQAFNTRMVHSGDTRVGSANLYTSDSRVYCYSETSTPGQMTSMKDDTPFAWEAGDTFACWGTYEAA